MRRVSTLVIGRECVISKPLSRKKQERLRITYHNVPTLNDVSSSMIRHQSTPRIVLFPTLTLSLWGRTFTWDLFQKTSSDLVLESELHPAVLRYMRERRLYMYSPESVGKRNRSRLYVFAQCLLMASVVLRDVWKSYA